MHCSLQEKNYGFEKRDFVHNEFIKKSLREKSRRYVKKNKFTSRKCSLISF